MEESCINSILYSELAALFEYHDIACRKLEIKFKENLKKVRTFFNESECCEAIAIDKSPHQTKKRFKQYRTLLEENAEDNIINKQETSEDEHLRLTKLTRAAKLNLKKKQSSETVDQKLTNIKEQNIDENKCHSEADKMSRPSCPALRTRNAKQKRFKEFVNTEILKPIKLERISIINTHVTNSTLEKNEINYTISLNSINSHKEENKTIMPKPIITKEEERTFSGIAASKGVKIGKTLKRNNKNPKKMDDRRSSESVYEDAIPFPIQLEKQFKKKMPKKLTSKFFNGLEEILINDKTEKKSLDEKFTDGVCSIFTSGKSFSIPQHNISDVMDDATFAKDSTYTHVNQVTFVFGNKSHNANATATLKQGDSTEPKNPETNVDAPIYSDANLAETYIRNSIMTEDNSDKETEEHRNISKMNYKPKPKSKMNKNNSIKKNVQAFAEKIAAYRKNIPSTQQDKEKAIAKQNSENVKPKNRAIGAFNYKSKNVVLPLGSIRFSQTSSKIPVIGNSAKKKQNSASKATDFTKISSSVCKTSTRPEFSQSRENGIDKSLKSNYLKFKHLTDDGKQKLEEKRQLLLKRAEKERNNEKRKLEKQILMKKQPLMEIKNREMLTKNQNKMAKENLKKINEIPTYNFDMLQTDDETDDEEIPLKMRPQLPQWSRKEVRQKALEMQTYMPTSISDSFFSVQPLTPDLREIFPGIHRKYLNRNSSMFWSTPQRYSQIPNY